MLKLLQIIVLACCGILLGSCSQPDTRTGAPTEKTGSTALVAPKQQLAPVPLKVIQVLEYIRLHHTAPPGYVGSRSFGNFEGRLPETDSAGKRIYYQEWDVNPHHKGINRGAERLITGSDSSAWYTPNHYESFIPVKDAN